MTLLYKWDKECSYWRRKCAWILLEQRKLEQKKYVCVSAGTKKEMPARIESERAEEEGVNCTF
jgi:hypothetical protein